MNYSKFKKRKSFLRVQIFKSPFQFFVNLCKKFQKSNLKLFLRVKQMQKTSKFKKILQRYINSKKKVLRVQNPI